MTTKTPKKPLVLVDGSSYLFRAYHAMPALTNSSGEPTGAVRGVISMIRRLQKDYPSSSVVVIFDAKGPTFRNDIYADYKAHRPPMPDELRVQIEPIHRIIKAMGLPLLVIDGVEADDVIGTLANEATTKGIEVIVSTGDKDLAQLVSKHVTLINTMNDRTTTIESLQEKYGFGPELFVDYLALMGDKVDNIPGVPGVGEKTALALLQGLGSLDNIYQQLERIAELSFRGSKSMAKKLEEHKEQAYLSRTLATIKTDVDLPFSLEKLKVDDINNEELVTLFTQLEFKGWLEELLGNQQETLPENKQAPADYHTIFTQKDFQNWLDRLKKAPIIAFDTETTSLNYMEAEIVGVSFAVQVGEAAYVPVAHTYPGCPDQLDRDWVLTQLKPLLEAEKPGKIGQNLKYDMSVLARYDIELKGIAADTMLESYVLNSTATRHDMDSLALKYLGYKTTHYEDVAGKGAKQITFDQVGIEQAAPYAAEDADITLQLYHTLWPKLEAESKLASLCDSVEKPLIPVLSRMERNGALIDSALLNKQSKELAKRLAELEQQAYDAAGQTFNLGSPKQLQEIFFEKLKLPVIKKTPKGQPSTAEPVLQELALDYPLPKLILEYRGLSKLKSTYTDRLPEQVNPHTDRVHTSFHQAVTATGRLSSSDPNLQNIPIRSAEGRRIRQAFIAPKGYKIVSADYSQIELRIMAHLSADSGLKSAFAHGMDVHKATAAEVFGVPHKEVTDNQRRNAKAINFGLIYGMSAFGLAKQLGISRQSAQEYIDLYFERYPGVLNYMESIREQAAEQGYVETILGRRLYLPEIRSRNALQRKAAERTAINAPMQGTAADIIKQAMIAVDQWLSEQKVNAKMIMQVHDELVFEVQEEQVAFLTENIKSLMEKTTLLDVPLLVDVGVGNNWDEAH
ncbi:DNA polymerase I [Zooshikella harenae]|uniref:DNA polymerase I n=1 Tax=Zooshikella harenae TaxID=2827238 RepID=A0ABS5ZC35_9GAMM|nr:DNA polymerase I [Zooshikella harenae]MBU2710820.1 DNA polymerase I [Zooshikella harenae]